MTFDFHRAQARARFRSLLLRGLLGVLLAAFAVGVGVFVWTTFEAARETVTRLDPVRGWAAVGAALAGLAMAAGSVRAFVRERQTLLDGRRVADLLRAREVSPRPWSEGERVLRNVTEEIAVAAGLPAPRLYLIPDQPGINALAVGPDVAHGAVLVSESAAENLSRPALQAVVAHEIAHLAVGDAALHAVSSAATMALGTLPRAVGRSVRSIWRLLAVDAGDKDLTLTESLTSVLVLVVGMVLGSALFVPGVIGSTLPILVGLPALAAVGWLASRALDRMVSHQTEYGADALAVELTRDPDGLADALKSLRDTSLKGLIVNAPVDRLQPFFFARPFPVPPFMEGLVESHPTPGQRLRKLRIFEQSERWRAGRARSLAAPTVLGDRPPARTLAAEPPDARPGPLAAAGTLLEALPAPLRDAAHDLSLVEPLLYALVLDPSPRLRLRQRYLLGDHAEAALALFEQLGALPRAARLPLVEIALPSARRLDADATARLLSTTGALTRADGRVSVPELVLCEALHRGLSPAPTPRPAGAARIVRAAAPLLSMLAHAGAPTPAERTAAYAVGARVLAEHVPGALAPLRPPSATAFRESIGVFASADGAARDAALAAALAVARADGRTTDAEADLVRVLALAFGQPCPLPLPSLSVRPVPSAALSQGAAA